MKNFTCVVRDLSVHYDRIMAVQGLSFEVAEGQSLCIVGHNGAGKSSTLMATSGALRKGVAGTMSLHGDNQQRIDHPLPLPSDIALRIVPVPEKEKIFNLLTVHENLQAMAINAGVQPADIGISDVYDFFPRLADRRSTIAGNLSGGEQQMLAIGGALVRQPRILMIDEPTLGLAVPVIEMLCEKLTELRHQLGLTMIIALAETAWVGHFADRAFVMDCGNRISNYIASSSSMRDELEGYMSGELKADPAMSSVDFDSVAREVAHA